MNGLKHERVIRNYVEEYRIVRGVTTWTAGIDKPGRTHLMGSGPVEIGSLVPEGKDNVKVVVDILNKAELNGVESDNLHQSIWKRFASMEQPTRYVVSWNVI